VGVNVVVVHEASLALQRSPLAQKPRFTGGAERTLHRRIVILGDREFSGVAPNRVLPGGWEGDATLWVLNLNQGQRAAPCGIVNGNAISKQNSREFQSQGPYHLIG